MNLEFDIIVVGGGHAGCEAAASAANLGSKVLLISLDITKLAQMSCNPAMGGVGKGQIIREIDALGGYSAIVTDKTTIHFKMLNTSKGNAMWSPRAQCDRMLFSKIWREELESVPNLFLLQDEVTDIKIAKKKIIDLRTKNGMVFYPKAIIITAGTFLNGLIHIGETKYKGGRIGENSADSLSNVLVSNKIKIGRMKTGTPVRIDGRSLDFSEFIPQPSDLSGKFSFLKDVKSQLPRRDCYIVHTNKKVHQILKEGFEKSPLFTGKIKGIGPRYCPSIEDKIRTFYSKDSHQLFVEPEGISTYEYYLNGFSSSLPWDIQLKGLYEIPGFKNVHILRPGYAIEYDYFDPTQLHHTLESKIIPNLFFAGQVNGTTGYEEAAGQGLIAGINAHLKINRLPKFTLNRDIAYIGVMIDDLVTKGVDEPYRVFTSRAEYRILLRQDNADERLTSLGKEIGLVKNKRHEEFLSANKIVETLIKEISKTSLSPNDINEFLERQNSALIRQKRKLLDLLARPEVKFIDLINNKIELGLSIPKDQLDENISIKVETKIKYNSYIEKEKATAEKTSLSDNIKINPSFDYSKLKSLSTEARQKLERIKPVNIGQAKRIPGVSPADINVLLVYFNK